MDTATRNKTVIQVCFSPAFGGLEMSSVKWTKLFAKAGYDSHIACVKNSKIAGFARSLGLNTVEFDKPTQYLSFSTRSGLKELINKLQPIAIVSHSTKDLWHLSPVMRKHPEIHLLSFARMFIRGIKKTDFLHRWIYSRVDRMIALSQIQKSLLLSALPLEDSKYVVIPNGVDIKKFSPMPANEDLKKELGWTGQGPLVGLIGRLDIQKGHLEFVKAARIIQEKYPLVRYVMVGGENSGEKNDSAVKIKSLIDKYSLGSLIKITGHRQDIPELLNSLDVFCMPSYEENFGNVMLEAMSCGAACVGTNSGGTPEMIADGHNGVLVSPRSSEALAGGILRFIEDEAFRRYAAKNARSTAIEKFDMQEVFKRVEELVDVQSPPDNSGFNHQGHMQASDQDRI